MKIALGNYWFFFMFSSIFIAHKGFAGEFEALTYTVNRLKRDLPKFRKDIEDLYRKKYEEISLGSLSHNFIDGRNYFQDHRYIRIGFNDGVSAAFRRTKKQNEWVYEQIGSGAVGSTGQPGCYEVEYVGLNDVPSSLFKEAVVSGEPLCLAPLIRKLKKSKVAEDGR